MKNEYLLTGAIITSILLTSVKAAETIDEVEAEIAEMQEQIAIACAKMEKLKLELKLANMNKDIDKKRKDIDDKTGATARKKEAAEKQKRETEGTLGVVDVMGFIAPKKIKAAAKQKDWLYRPITRDSNGRIKSNKFRLGNLGQWDLDYAVAKFGTRIYFDTGSMSEGEFDQFKDGELEASIEMLNFYAHRPFFGTGIDWGPNAAIGIVAGSEGKDGKGGSAASLIASYGFFLRPKDAVWQVETGFMTAISADESLDATTRDDTAFYVGISMGGLIDSAKQKIKKK